MFRYSFILLINLIVIIARSYGQELYPLSEPASNIPKNVLGVRLFSESYREADIKKHVESFRIMYGLSSRWSIMGTLSASNHHGKYLPTDLITHTHSGTQSITYTNEIRKGQDYEYKLNGLHLYSKYRFLSLDGQNKHLRMALYGEYSIIKAAHDEAETNLKDDNSGFGSGFIITWLQHKFAGSISAGFIKAKPYEENIQKSLNPILTNTKINYGYAFPYSLSLGYLLYPRKYTNYDQANINLYAEFVGKSYQQAKIIQDGENIPSSSKALRAGNYVDFRPGVQAIFNSNLRIDLTIGVPLIKRSYVYSYPLVFIAVQRYFYL